MPGPHEVLSKTLKNCHQGTLVEILGEYVRP